MKRKAYHIFTVKNEVIKAFFRFLNAQETLTEGFTHHMVLTPEIAQDLFANNFEAYPNLQFEVHSFAIKNWLSTQLKYVQWMRQADKVFLHYMPTYNAPLLASFFEQFRNKVVWLIWGGDAHKTLYLGRKAILFDALERPVFKRLGFISSSQEIEYTRAVEVFKIPKAKYIPLFYSIDVFKTNPKTSGQNGIFGERIKILLGNNACPTNRHIEAIDLIKSNIQNFGGEVEIHCPLSYSITDLAYQQRVIEHGKSVFGDAFVAITDYQKPEDYFEFMAGMDVFIMNHQRQRGIGVIRTALFWGKVVYMAAANINLHHFKSEGLHVLQIEQLNHEPLIRTLTNEEQSLNFKIMLENYGENRALQLWLEALNMPIELNSKVKLD